MKFDRSLTAICSWLGTDKMSAPFFIVLIFKGRIFFVLPICQSLLPCRIFFVSLHRISEGGVGLEHPC